MELFIKSSRCKPIIEKEFEYNEIKQNDEIFRGYHRKCVKITI